MNDRLKSVADLVERASGIETKEPQLAALAAAVERVSAGMDAEGFLAALSDPVRGADLLGRLIDQVAIQETFFMREPRELEAIEWHQLLAAAHARGAPEVRVWVSACASGEEAYSVAMLAAEAFGRGLAPVSILATDISARALRRAEEGVYSQRSTRDVSAARRERFFVDGETQGAVGDELRSSIRFRRHNLVAEPAPPSGEVPFDLILCRNVLIYFGAATVETVVASLESALVPGGQLILGASDRLTSSAQRLAGATSGLQPAAPGVPRQRARSHRSARVLRKPLGAQRPDVGPAAPRPSSGTSVGEALEAANAGDYPTAVEITERILSEDPLDADAYFVRGLAELAADDPGAAARSLRRALYVDPTFALAAFQLGRSQDRRGDTRAALRAYSQALRTIDPDDTRHQDLRAQIGVDDIAAACRARLADSRDRNSPSSSEDFA